MVAGAVAVVAVVVVVRVATSVLITHCTSNMLGHNVFTLLSRAARLMPPYVPAARFNSVSLHNISHDIFPNCSTPK